MPDQPSRPEVERPYDAQLDGAIRALMAVAPGVTNGLVLDILQAQHAATVAALAATAPEEVELLVAEFEEWTRKAFVTTSRAGIAEATAQERRADLLALFAAQSRQAADLMRQLDAESDIHAAHRDTIENLRRQLAEAQESLGLARTGIDNRDADLQALRARVAELEGLVADAQDSTLRERAQEMSSQWMAEDIWGLLDWLCSNSWIRVDVAPAYVHVNVGVASPPATFYDGSMQGRRVCLLTALRKAHKSVGPHPEGAEG